MDSNPTRLGRVLGWEEREVSGMMGGLVANQGVRVRMRSPHDRSHTPSDYYILLGYQELQHPTEHSVQMTVNQVIIHENFNKHSFLGSDIALLQLHQAVNFTSHVLPACLADPNSELTHHTCWITGWGMVTEEGGQGRGVGAGRRDPHGPFQP